MLKKSGFLLLGCTIALAATSCSLSPNAEPANRLKSVQADIDLKTLPDNPDSSELVDLPADQVKGLENASVRSVNAIGDPADIPSGLISARRRNLPIVSERRDEEGIRRMPPRRDEEEIRRMPPRRDEEGIRRMPPRRDEEGIRRMPPRRDEEEIRRMPPRRDEEGIRRMPPRRDEEEIRRTPPLTGDFRWMRRGENWIPYRYWEGRYHPYRVFRQGHYYRVIYIFVYPNYFPQYIPDEGPIYQPWMSQMYVSIQNYSFNPSYLRVDRGTTVTWTNGDSVPHTVTTNGPSIDSFDSGVMYPGSSYSHTFNLNGAFGYHCRLHPYMRGEVQVGNPY